MATDERERSLLEQISSFESKLDASSRRCNVKVLYQKLQALKERPAARGLGQISSLHKLYAVVQNEHERKETDFEVVYSSDATLQYFDWYLEFIDFLKDLKTGFDDRIYTPLKTYFMDKRFVTPLPVRTASRSSTLLSISTIRLSSDPSDFMRMNQVGMDALKDEFAELADIYENNEIAKLSSQLHRLNDQWEVLLDYDTELYADMFEIDLPAALTQNGVNPNRDVSNLVRLVPDIIMKGKRSVYVAKKWIRCYGDRSKMLEDKLQKLSDVQQKMSLKLVDVDKDIKEKEKQLADTSQTVDWLLKREERSEDINIQLYDTEQSIENLQAALDEKNKEKNRLATEMLEMKHLDKDTLALQKVKYEENRLKRYILDRKIKAANYQHNILKSDFSVEMEVKPSIIRFTNDAQEKYEQLERELDEKQKMKRKIEQALVPLQTDQRLLDSRIKGRESPEYQFNQSFLSSNQSVSIPNSPRSSLSSSPPNKKDREQHKKMPMGQEFTKPDRVLFDKEQKDVGNCQVPSTEIAIQQNQKAFLIEQDQDSSKNSAAVERRTESPIVHEMSSIYGVEEANNPQEKPFLQIVELEDPQPKQKLQQKDLKPKPKSVKNSKSKPVEHPPWQHTFKPTTVGKPVSKVKVEKTGQVGAKKQGPKKPDTNKVKTEIMSGRQVKPTPKPDHPKNTLDEVAKESTMDQNKQEISRSEKSMQRAAICESIEIEPLETRNLSQLQYEEGAQLTNKTNPEKEREEPVDIHNFPVYQHVESQKMSPRSSDQPNNLQLVTTDGNTVTSSQHQPPGSESELYNHKRETKHSKPMLVRDEQTLKLYELEHQQQQWQRQQHEQQQLLIKQQQQLIQQQQQILRQSQEIVKPLLEVQTVLKKDNLLSYNQPQHNFNQYVPLVLPQVEKQIEQRLLSSGPIALSSPVSDQHISKELLPQCEPLGKELAYSTNADEQVPSKRSEKGARVKLSISQPRQNVASKLRQHGKIEKDEKSSKPAVNPDARPKQHNAKLEQASAPKQLNKFSSKPAAPPSEEIYEGESPVQSQSMESVRALRRLSSLEDFIVSMSNEDGSPLPEGDSLATPNPIHENPKQVKHSKSSAISNNRNCSRPKSILKKDIDVCVDKGKEQKVDHPFHKDKRVAPIGEAQKTKPTPTVTEPKLAHRAKPRPPTPKNASLKEDGLDEKVNYPIQLPVPDAIPKYKSPFLAYGHIPEDETRVKPVTNVQSSPRVPRLQDISKQEDDWSTSSHDSFSFEDSARERGKVRFNENVDVVADEHQDVVINPTLRGHQGRRNENKPWYQKSNVLI